jgi:SAM-dependent methyltransferase
MFFYWVRENFPDYFKGSKVLDVGSLNINGCNRLLFSGCDYTGLDIGEGENVDVVCKAHEHDVPDGHYDVIISGECFEHDMYIEKTLANIVRMLRPGGLFVFTCAADNRDEHGTRSTDPDASPFTSKIEGWCDYYRGFGVEEMSELFPFYTHFHPCNFNMVERDLHFYGIKKGGGVAEKNSDQSFDEFSSQNNISRLVKTPYYLVCGTVKGVEGDQWFVVKGDNMYSIDDMFKNLEPDPMGIYKIKHEGEMLLKEDLGCMNTKQE